MKKTTQQINELRERRRELEEALRESLLGAQSASLGTGGNTQSYTRWNPGQLREEIRRINRQIGLLLRAGRTRRTSPDFANGGAYGH